MAIPRMHLVDESCSSLYHCVSRTVRQAFLLAPQSEGVVDNHRRDGVLERVRLQSQVFAIDCVSLAVMSNHLHLLLRTMPELVESWSAFEVAHRWLLLRPPRMIRQKLGIDPDSAPQEQEIDTLAGNANRIAVLRGRLSSLSWYMKELKERIARRVNREEGRTGAFWEERFRSFRVLDDPGMLRCATYIDLNPVAAGMVDEPMLARYTSVAEFARSPGGDVGDPDRRLAARALWKAVLDEGTEDADPAGDAKTGEQLDAFIASFDDVKFQPAVPARREPHHPRGAAADDEPIDAVRVLGKAVHQRATEAGRETHAGAEPMADGPADGAQVGADEEHIASHEHDTPGEERSPAGATGTASPPLPPPRQARHRREPPDVRVHEITLGEHFRRLRRLAALAQERGLARRNGRFRRRSVVEIEMALGREADDHGIATLFAEMFGTDLDGSAAEIAGLLSGLLGGARHFGTAIGSKAALAAEALRRGRARVVEALRTAPPRRRGSTATARGDPATPRVR